MTASAPSPGVDAYRRGHGRREHKADTMTTLQNRPNTALLVVDVQTGAVEGAHQRDAGRTAGTVETKDVDFGAA